MSDSLWPHGQHHVRLPCPSPTPGACSNLYPLSQWCHPTISSSVVPFSCLESFPSSGSFPMSLLFTSGGLSIGVSASATVLPMNIQDWSPLGWTGWISRQSKGLSRVFSNTTVQKHPLSTSGSWGKGLWSCFFYFLELCMPFSSIIWVFRVEPDEEMLKGKESRWRYSNTGSFSGIDVGSLGTSELQLLNTGNTLPSWCLVTSTQLLSLMV